MIHYLAAPSGTDWVGIIGAILTPISVIVLAYFSLLAKRQGEATHNKVVQIDEAVNGKAPGQTSISQDITTIKEKQEFDSPTEEVAIKANGDVALKEQVAHLLTLVGKLVDKEKIS